MRDPFGPLNQGEELLVCCLADIGDWVVGLERNKKERNAKTMQAVTVLVSAFSDI